MTPPSGAESTSESGQGSALKRLRAALQDLERSERISGERDALSMARLEEEEAARQSATRSLSAAPRTRRQLETKLAADGIDEDVVSRVLDRYEEVGLIDDAAYAREWIRVRAVHKHVGPAALREELRRKGVAREHIEAALAELLPPEAEADHGLELARVKTRAALSRARGKDLQDRQERQKIIQKVAAAVARKGYGPGEAFQWSRQSVDEAIDCGQL